MKFEEFNMNKQLLEAISYMGFEKTTPVQEQAIPEILKGNDLIACAQTGTGKTAAFLLPILHHMIEKGEKQQALIIVPTRELVIQIDQQVQGIAYFAGIDSVTVYGGGDGGDWETEKKALSEGTRIVIGTPGKLISHLNMGYVNFKNLKYLILDEADRMLDIGFYDDILRIIRYLPEKRQTLLFSATMPPRIRDLASKILSNPSQVSISVSKPAEGVLQGAFATFDNQKMPLLNSLIKDKPDYKSILIFCSTRKKVTEIVKMLKQHKYNVEGISSDLEQHERNDVLNRFKSRQIRVLVATDVLSRGIDIKDINLIINYDVPGDAEDYIHRVGRTARAETTGVALTFVNSDDMYKFKKIETLISDEVAKIPLHPDLGEGPPWNLDKPSKPQGFRKFNKGKSKGR